MTVLTPGMSSSSPLSLFAIASAMSASGSLRYPRAPVSSPPWPGSMATMSRFDFLASLTCCWRLASACGLGGAGTSITSRSGTPSAAASTKASGVVDCLSPTRTTTPVSETAGKMSATRLSPTNSDVTASDFPSLGITISYVVGPVSLKRGSTGGGPVRSKTSRVWSGAVQNRIRTSWVSGLGARGGDFAGDALAAPRRRAAPSAKTERPVQDPRLRRGGPGLELVWVRGAFSSRSSLWVHGQELRGIPPFDEHDDGLLRTLRLGA